MLHVGQRGIRCIQRAWSHYGAERLQQAKAGITIDFLLKAWSSHALLEDQHRWKGYSSLYILSHPSVCHGSRQSIDIPGGQVLALWLLKKHRPRAHRVVELFCLAIPIADGICSWQVILAPIQ